jgi:ATP-binding cassette subfamily F protein 3
MLSAWKSTSPPPTSTPPSFSLPRTAAGARSAAEIEDAVRWLWRQDGASSNITLTLRPGEPRRPARPQRRRQVDADQAARRRASQQPLAAARGRQGPQAIGYFAQHQLEQLRPDESPLQHMVRLDPQTREQDLRDYLGGFDFRGDMAAPPATTPCGPFSGGEKSRLALPC